MRAKKLELQSRMSAPGSTTPTEYPTSVEFVTKPLLLQTGCHSMTTMGQRMMQVVVRIEIESADNQSLSQMQRITPGRPALSSDGRYDLDE